MKTWTKEEIQTLINTNDQAVIRGLLAIYNRQTADEKQSEDTKHVNGIGFNGCDARFGSNLAEQILEWENAPVKKFPKPLSPGQIKAGRKMIYKYCGQLTRIANGE